MKLADYVAEYLVSQGIKHVFVVSGGAAIHMIDSVARNPKIDYICSQHEQHSGAEADGYSRISNNLGAVIVTSGPGGTNLATSIANAFYDSIPIIFLCGQVSTFRLKKNPGLRQKGFQETDIVGMFKPITKYASQLRVGEDIA
ncbi:thiamine pyrophosphate-binding protein, partial [Candidatus Gottesmanbacteria bacterium]|nr:thiamine pyrophosphate-binding protein [Candidatus Gottesmanbacteria bacterium]